MKSLWGYMWPHTVAGSLQMTFLIRRHVIVGSEEGRRQAGNDSLSKSPLRRSPCLLLGS